MNWHQRPCLALLILYLCLRTTVLFDDLKKLRFRSQLIDVHLNSMSKVVTAKSLVPDINMLVSGKGCQV